jgi:hypothetical protein
MHNADGCVDIGDVSLCYKKVGDRLDWETLQNILVALKQIDDRVNEWINKIKLALGDAP